MNAGLRIGARARVTSMPRIGAGGAALLALLALPGAAGAASLSGTIVEKGGKAPLAAVDVVVRGVPDSTVVHHATTGADGRFRVDSLRAGRYALRAALVGYLPYRIPELTLTGAAALDLGTITLAVAPVAVKGVEVSTARATAILAPDRNIYLARDIAGAASGSATDVLRAVPELDVDIDGRVSLRGSSSVTIQLNGRASPLKGDALTTFLKQLPSSRIERVEVLANPSAKYDPEGAAGIVNLVLKGDASLGISGSVNGTVGDAWTGPGTRIAWQQGPVTMFGGISGSLGRGSYSNDTNRLDYLSSPPGSFASASGSAYRSGYGFGDASVDVALTGKVTLYGTAYGYRNASDTDAFTQAALTDSTSAATRYVRSDASRADGHTASYTLGLQHVVQQGKNERSIELLVSDSDYGNRSAGLQRTLEPSGVADQISRQTSATGDHQRSLEADDTHPLGAHGKLEAGYRGVDRHTTNSGALAYFAGDSLIVTPQSAANDYELHEIFHSGYLTLGSTFGRLSVQIGARGELARAAFDLRSSGQSFDHDYRSLFPSANLAWDFGGGRTMRVTYSKRIERPSAYYLNPDVPTTDSLNHYVGNPYLGPKYTHSVTLDASWTGGRGSLRLSPYFRETTGNWDQVTTVDTNGVATTTWRNASAVRFLGVSVTASLRQTGRLGGTVGASVYREHHDAGNLSSQYRSEATNGSANANLTFKLTPMLDLQGYLRFSPAQTLAQGRSSTYTFLNLGARWKVVGEKLTASLWVRDPFNMAHFSRTTGDSTYAQTSSSHNSLRGAAFTLSWTWGHAPNQTQRRQSAEESQPDATGPAR